MTFIWKVILETPAEVSSCLHHGRRHVRAHLCDGDRARCAATDLKSRNTKVSGNWVWQCDKARRQQWLWRPTVFVFWANSSVFQLFILFSLVPFQLHPERKTDNPAVLWLMSSITRSERTHLPPFLSSLLPAYCNEGLSSLIGNGKCWSRLRASADVSLQILTDLRHAAYLRKGIATKLCWKT